MATRSHATRFAMSVPSCAEFLQCEQTEFTAEVLDSQLPVVVVVLALELHAA